MILDSMGRRRFLLDGADFAFSRDESSLAVHTQPPAILGAVRNIYAMPSFQKMYEQVIPESLAGAGAGSADSSAAVFMASDILHPGNKDMYLSLFDLAAAQEFGEIPLLDGNPLSLTFTDDRQLLIVEKGYASCQQTNLAMAFS
jgi:hypothetical protein